MSANDDHRKQALRLLTDLGVKLPLTTKLSQSDLEDRLSKALDCAQRQAVVFGDRTKINPKNFKKWEPKLFNLSYSMFSPDREESITGEIDGSSFTALRMFLSQSVAGALTAVPVGETQFSIETAENVGSIQMKITSVNVAAEGLAIYALDFLADSSAGDNDEGGKVLLNSDTYFLLLKVLELNASRTDAADTSNVEAGWKSSYLLPLGSISMKDIGSLTKNAGCIVCGQKGSNVCAGCRMVSYCSKDCQRSDWANHKEMCRSLETGTWVDFKAQSEFPHMTTINRKDRSDPVIPKKPTRSNAPDSEPFLVKVQTTNTTALVYDRKRTFQEMLFIDENPQTFQRLADVVGLKMYLWAKQTGPHVLSICLDRKPKQSEIDW